MLNGLKVMIVDDQKTMLRILRSILSQIGIENVEEASDGQMALGKLVQGKYDLIISDWNMMPMTGLELLQYVRRDATYGHKGVCFIMVTAESRVENLKEAIAAGVDNYIIKPFDAETISAKIMATLAKKKA